MTSITRQLRSINCIPKACSSFILTIILLADLGITMLAQTASRPDRGIRPVGSYSVSDIENISMTNGNVNLSIPLAALPPMAGGDLSWVVRAEYSSKLWDKPGVEVNQTPPVSNYTNSTLQLGDSGGWRISGGYNLSIHHVNEDHQGVPPADEQDPDWYFTEYRSKMILTTPDGAKHELRPVDYASYPSGQGNHDYQRGFYKDTPAANSVNVTMRYYSFDGSYLWAKINPFPAFGSPQSWSVYLSNGTIVEQNNGIQRIKDTNGNNLKIWSDIVGSVPTTHWQDEQTGREIKYGYNAATNIGQMQYQTVGGSWVSIDINFGTTSVHGMTYLAGDPCLIEKEVNTDITVIRSIIFPLTKPGEARRHCPNPS